MYPGTIEMAAKLHHEALATEGRREQFLDLHCGAPAGIWRLTPIVRQWVGIRLRHACTLVQSMHIVVGKIPGRVTTAAQGAEAA